jgi:hypothetical protein
MKVGRIICVGLSLMESRSVRSWETQYILIAVPAISLLTLIDALVGRVLPDFGLLGPVLLGIVFVALTRWEDLLGIVAFLRGWMLIRRDPALFE